MSRKKKDRENRRDAPIFWTKLIVHFLNKISSIRFASLKINTKIVKYISRKGGIKKRRRKVEEWRR